MGAARYEGVAAPGIGAATPLASTAALPVAPVVRAFEQRAPGWQDLPGAAREIEAVSRLFAPAQRRVYVGAEATEARLRSLDAQHELARYRYLLFSAHGYLSMESPALSAIVLGVDAAAPAFDGYVTAAEWVGFDLASELIVLSACETASGRQLQGEGVMGLPFALFVAGNRNALLSLWPVQDDSTALFMQRFFARVHAGERHGDALAATKRELAADPRYRSPRHWAPFLLYGD
jgi:CHAT domain-containing protein